ncbi:MAG: 5'/3'-nucleotidase SurE [Prevotellamassilia sp.]
MAIRPYLLISNDDGVTAPGIQFLVEALRPYADILVMAPDSARSGFSCSITSAQPITYKVLREEEGLTVCSCSGTPTDCVKMALNLFPDRRPDLVIGGINHGDNSSVNAHYSGTMGVAIEGALQGFPSIAFSLCDHRWDADFEPLRPYLVDFMYKSLALALPPFTCLNVNFPAVSKFKGVKVCRMAYSRWTKEVEERKHPWGGKYYWLVGENIELEPEATDTDRWALAHGYVAVTPTQLDVTAKELVEVLREVL